MTEARARTSITVSVETHARIETLAESAGVGQEVIIMWGLDVLENELWLSKFDRAEELCAICEGIPSACPPA